MKHDPVEWLPLTLRPALDAPADMPRSQITVAVPVYPRARQVDLDTRQVFGFSPSFYVNVADPVSYEVALGMDSLREWFDASLADASYRCDPTIGHSGDVRTGESVAWTVLDVCPSTMPGLTIQVTLRPRDASSTIVTYHVEQYPVPPRDPASFLPLTVQRVDVEYTFTNGPERTVRRIITDLSDVRALVEVLNTFARAIRPVSFGRFMDRWANLRFTTVEDTEIRVYVDPAHDVIRINGFPELSGSVWALLLELAPPGKGAGEIPGD
ncbi:MAG: hypothetical protein M3Z66_10015 [Chloroflexota bacterium]|nr:hypothetical protein [Chloroflexota bacterium]